MPYIETPDELADHIADLIYPSGIYHDTRCPDQVGEQDGYLDTQHIPDCNCRVYWVPRMAERIRQAVNNENLVDHAH